MVNARSFSVIERALDLPAAFVPMAAVVEEFGGIDVSATRPLAEVIKGYTSFVEGDVLFAKITPCMENGKVALVPPLANHVGFGSTEFHVLRSSGAVEPKWIAYYVSQLEFRKAARQDMSGSAGQLRVQSGWIASATLPVAPLAEQSRILLCLEELITELDAGVAELLAAQKKLTQYRQSLLKAAVEGDLTAEWRAKNPPLETGAELLARILCERRAQWEARQLKRFVAQQRTPPIAWRENYPEPAPLALKDLPELPPGWAWASLDQLLCEIRSGSAETSGRQPTEYPILKSSAVRQADIDFGALNYLQAAQSGRHDNYVERGDVLITRLSGSVEYVGCCAVVQAVPPFRVQYPDRVFCGKPVLADSRVSGLIEVSFQAPLVRSLIEVAAKSTAGHKRISLSDLYPLPIALPPLAEIEVMMDAVQAAASSAESSARSVDAGLRMAAAQRQNILRAAFSGQLVPQDPNDEPAAALLARIRAQGQQAGAKPARRAPRRAQAATA